jgi:hypothetical protein
MKPLMSMRACLADPNLFANILHGDSWAAWCILLIALVGEELTVAERASSPSSRNAPRSPASSSRSSLASSGVAAVKVAP